MTLRVSRWRNFVLERQCSEVWKHLILTFACSRLKEEVASPIERLAADRASIIGSSIPEFQNDMIYS